LTSGGQKMKRFFNDATVEFLSTRAIDLAWQRDNQQFISHFLTKEMDSRLVLL
jgi:hypothetical protein